MNNCDIDQDSFRKEDILCDAYVTVEFKRPTLIYLALQRIMILPMPNKPAELKQVKLPKRYIGVLDTSHASEKDEKHHIACSYGNSRGPAVCMATGMFRPGLKEPGIPHSAKKITLFER